jgi:hypothetical protein
LGENKVVDNKTRGLEKAIIFWLSGIRLSDISALPEVTNLKERGAVVELRTSPITGPLNQHFQVFSGRDPSSFGFFDTIVPRDYSIQEESVGRGGIPKMLPDLLRSAGWMVQFEVALPTELASCIDRLTQTVASLPSCLIVKCAVNEPSTLSTLAEALRIADEWVGEFGLLALLSDAQPTSVKHFVNVNNLLAEMDIIERDKQSGQINWPGTLAYFAGHGQLWVNLVGRDSQGAVFPQDEYEEVRDTLVKVLPAKLCEDQTGHSIIERVYRKEDLYTAEYLFCAPDLVVLFKPGYAPSPRSTRINFDETTFTTPEPGVSVMEGIHPSMLGGFLLACAPPLARGIALTDRFLLTSVLPTLLHAFGVEITGVESPAISALFNPSYLELHPIRSGLQSQGLSEEDEELIINRLRDLGYV